MPQCPAQTARPEASRPSRSLSPSCSSAAVLAGCSKNPVTGKKEFAPYSTRDEINLGNRHYRPLQQAQGGRFGTDPRLAAYVRQVGRRVAKVSDRTKLPYEFVVLNNTVPNAWALPGGKIGINRGLLLELENEAELAAVLSHEVVHSAARHGGQALTRNLLFGVAQLAIALTGRKSPNINYILGGTGLAFQLINRGYSREAEREADFYGMKYMRAAGYDTRVRRNAPAEIPGAQEGPAARLVQHPLLDPSAVQRAGEEQPQGAQEIPGRRRSRPQTLRSGRSPGCGRAGRPTPRLTRRARS